MCGFFISNSSEISKKHQSLIEKKLRFRGPDGSSGLIERNGWKSYHSRLSIIDIETGTNQPMIDNDGGLLVFNGEILNFKSLGLKYFDREFKSDTELLSLLLQKEKLNIKELDGFFSFIYINAIGELKYAVRDFFGVKPLFFFENQKGISFCSEPSVLKKLFNCEVNEDAIEEYYATRSPIFSTSYFEGIKAVEPGSCYVSGQYFNCADYITSNKYETFSEQDLEKTLKKSINSRLISDAPVGLLLSRGIDSNLIRSMTNFERFYSIGFLEDEDVKYLKNENLPNLTLIECTANEYKEAFDYLLQLRSEPMSVPNEVLLFLIAKRASSDGIKVLLSGEGADEFFGGYDRIFQWAKQSDKFNVDEFLDKYCYTKPEKNSKLYKQFEHIFNEQEFNSVFETVRWFFIRYHMPVLFRRLDFALMAGGIEGREPIATLHTFLKAIKISPQDLMGEKLGKLPLRKILTKYMGAHFSYEKKTGFPVDLTKIFENKNNLTSYELWFYENLKVLKK